MLLRFLFSVCLLAGVSLASVAQGINTTSMAVFDRTHINLNAVPTGVEQTMEFTIVSTGLEPVVIYGIKPECSCTSADWPEEPIAPGASGTISVTFTANSAGSFEKWILVRTNASNAAQTKLTFGGTAKD